MSKPDPYNHLNKPLAIVLDDHKMYAETFASFIERLPYFSNVLTFYKSEAVTEYIFNLTSNPEVYFFVDYYLEEASTSLSIINDIRRMYSRINTILVSSVSNPIIINHLLNYKLEGILSKSSRVEEVKACIQKIKDGQQYISPVFLELLASFNSVQKVPFSAREIEILEYFAKGLSVIETANQMVLSKHTIISHRRRMMSKTNTKSITELLAYARKLELI